MAAETSIDNRSFDDFQINRYEIDLTNLSINGKSIPCEDLDDVLGGIARGFKILEQYPTDNAYAADVCLIMNLGVLSGTQFMTGLRTYFHAYSPLKRSKSGLPSAMWTAGSGKFGTKLRFLEVEEVLFTGRCEYPTLLRISKSSDEEPAKFEFEDASFLQGKQVNDKIQTLKDKYGKEAHFAVIGPAGENYTNVRYAAIALSTENQLKSGDPKPRFCGRGGIGGVMGSKNLLAIVADVKDGKAASPSNFKDLNKEVARGQGSMRFREAKTGGLGGTWVNFKVLDTINAMPERNFIPTGEDTASGLYRDNFESLDEFVVKDEACYRCGIRCHKNVYDADENGKPAKFRAKLDYEPLNLLSANLGIYDPDQTCTLVELVDEMGMDSISCGVTLSYAMEYNERHKENGSRLTDGPFYGDFESTKRAIIEIGEGRLPLLGQGSLRSSEELGETDYAMHCKGIEFPAYLPQTNPGYPWALAGGHMSMRTYLLLLNERETGMDYWIDAITNPQRGMSILRDDILGTCKFTGLGNGPMAEAVSALTGIEIKEQDLVDAVMRTFLRGYRLEKRQGFTSDDYNMPADIHKEYRQIDLPHFNSQEFFAELRDKVIERFDSMLDEHLPEPVGQ